MKYRNISILNTLRLIFHTQPIGRLFVVINKGTGCDIEKSAKIVIEKGKLTINNKWTKSDPFKSLLFMGKDSTLKINGNFSIYSGSRIYINDKNLDRCCYIATWCLYCLQNLDLKPS